MLVHSRMQLAARKDLICDPRDPCQAAQYMSLPSYFLEMGQPMPG